jgi:hypothetical protein
MFRPLALILAHVAGFLLDILADDLFCVPIKTTETQRKGGSRGKNLVDLMSLGMDGRSIKILLRDTKSPHAPLPSVPSCFKVFCFWRVVVLSQSQR